jgi:cation transport regulator ChaC
MRWNFVGYGSLMSHDSLKETIKNKKFRPVIVKGYKRIFDLTTRRNENADVLNLKKSPKSFFNGVMFKVDDGELKKLCEREPEYNLEKTKVYDWKTKKLLGECFVVIDYFVGLDKNEKLPSKSYFILCREAAYHLNKKFGKMWDETTFISDNEKVSEWVKKNKEYDCLKG